MSLLLYLLFTTHFLLHFRSTRQKRNPRSPRKSRNPRSPRKQRS